MKLPLVPKYTERSLGNAQRCINMYFENGENGAQIVSTPGYPTSVVGGGSANGIQGDIHVASTGQVFGIVNDVLYEYNQASRTSRGTLGIGGGSDFRMADNGTTLLIVSNNYGARRCALAAASAVTTISDANFPSYPIGATFLDGYLITGTSSGTFYLSQLYDANDWTPIQFATAESSPDVLTDIAVVGRNLIILGSKTIETWYNTGNPDFPLERISGQTYPVGSVSGPSIAKGNGGIYFIGGENGGSGHVYFLSANGIEKISTPPITKTIIANSLVSWVGTYYNLDGESIYEISSSGVATYAYYAKSGHWIERTSYISSAYTSSAIAKYASYVNSNVEILLAFYRIVDKMSLVYGTVNDEAGTDIQRIYDFEPIGSNGSKMFHKSFVMDIDADFDTDNDLILDPTLSWTDDGGLNYSSGIQLSKTATSASPQSMRFKWTRLGSSRQRIYRITFVGPAAKLVIKNAEVDLVTGGPG